MNYEEDRKRQLRSEIEWIKKEIQKVKKPRHIKDLERQIKERDYELHLGVTLFIRNYENCKKKTAEAGKRILRKRVEA